MKPWVLSQAPSNLDVLAHFCGPRTEEVEAGGCTPSQVCFTVSVLTTKDVQMWIPIGTWCLANVRM